MGGTSEGTQQQQRHIAGPHRNFSGSTEQIGLDEMEGGPGVPWIDKGRGMARMAASKALQARLSSVVLPCRPADSKFAWSSESSVAIVKNTDSWIATSALLRWRL